MRRERLASAVALALTATAAFLPFVRGTLAGNTLYFRDLSLYFLPLRRFLLEGLARGELRLWNPFVHEGVPSSLPALGYPLDLVQLLRIDEPFLSFVLALHVPLAAVAFFLLARELGLARVAACGGGLLYALGGFLLSSVNLYVYLQAAAWIPLLLLGLQRVARGGSWRSVAGTAVALACAVSTTGVELVAQGLVAGALITPAGPWVEAGRRLRRLALAAALGMAATAPTLLLISGQVAASARGDGFPSDVVLAHSVHPFTLVQVVVAGLYGNPSNIAADWWGQNFFPRGFPYVVSLYLGAGALALAMVGIGSRHALRWRLALLGALALLVCLGRWAGIEPVVEALAPLRRFRYPVKAFFSVHLAIALLAALGLDTLARTTNGRPWRGLSFAAGPLGLLLALAPALPLLLPAQLAAFGRAFLPPGYTAQMRETVLRGVLADAAAGGTVALVLAGIGLFVAYALLAPSRGLKLAVALVAADLLRAGGGLNPMASPALLRPSPELAARLPALREGRVFSCNIDESPAYLNGRQAHAGRHEAWSFALLLETLTPAFNVPLEVPSAFSEDLTMLVPINRTLTAAEGGCGQLDAILPRLRAAGVATVLSIDPLSHPALRKVDSYAPRRIWPVEVGVYRVSDPLPLVELGQGPASLLSLTRRPGLIRATVQAEQPARLIVREGWAAGWQARLAGTRVPVLQLEGHHIAVDLPAGRCDLELRFWPAGLSLAAAVAGVAWLVLAGLAWQGGGARRQLSPGTSTPADLIG